jgi:hypothetical protein
VTHRGQHRLPEPRLWRRGYRSLLDQVCLDVPSADYEGESRFWARLTGWEPRPGALDEFDALARPPQAPLRVLLQRPGEGDSGPARAFSPAEWS